MNEKKQIPCKEGLWHTPSSPEGKPYLIGSKCPSCEDVVFPANPVCVNCQHQSMDEVRLNRNGKVWSFTTVMLPPPLWYKGPVPFNLGYVELPEGVKIWSRLMCGENKTLEIGQDVEFSIDVMQEDENGNEILGYCFIIQ